MSRQNESDKRFRHALHNEELATLLHGQDKYPDWVITISFYAALHFITAHLFPLVENDRLFNSFDEYWHSNKSGLSKHERRADLASKHLPAIAAPYKWLLDASQTARYNDYNSSQKMADKALENLSRIKAECTSFRSSPDIAVL